MTGSALGERDPLGDTLGNHRGLASKHLPAQRRSSGLQIWAPTSQTSWEAARSQPWAHPVPNVHAAEMSTANTCTFPSHALYLWGMSPALRGSVIWFSPFCTCRGQLKFSKLLCSFCDLLGRLRFIKHNVILYVQITNSRNKSFTHKPRATKQQKSSKQRAGSGSRHFSWSSEVRAGLKGSWQRY